MAVGALVGAACGAAGLALGLGISGAPSQALSLDSLGFGAIFGAPIGAVAAPILSWLLLRRVSLGLAIAWTALGSTVGGALGWAALSGRGDALAGAALGALTGFVAVAALLRRRAIASRDTDARVA